MIGQFKKTSEGQIGDIQKSSQSMLEKALQMRCHAYLSDMKADLLTQTIFEIDAGKKHLKSYSEKVEEQKSVIENQKIELVSKNEKLQHSREELERKVKERTRELEDEIEERKKIEIAHLKSIEEATHANHVKTQFLANMSHDLRTPLNAIIGYSEVLEAETFGSLGSKKNGEYVTDILNAGKDLATLVADILDISKIEFGELKLSEASVNIEETINACIRLVRSKYKDNKIDLQQDMASNLPDIQGDEIRIKQILVNLLTNSIKFTPSNGKVKVRGFLNDENAVVVEVIDNGIGMSKDDIEKSKEPFTQFADASLSANEGSGLGLFIAAKLVELHGGSLTIESEPNKRTTVRFTFSPIRTLEPD